jgi:hypothetical protein
VAFFQGLPVPNSDKEFTVAKGIVWNKWETDNFVILSIDFEFGKKLKSRVEKMKSEFFHSFGLRDNNLPVKCKIVCVPDPSILKKFFSLESPKYELRKDESGEIDEIAIWIDESRFDELPFLVASSCLLDSPEFISKGLPSLVYLSPSKISELIQSSEGTLNLDSDSTLGHSLLACLFFRKEFGSANFSRIVSGQVPWVVCGFSDKESLVSSLERYSSNLKLDLKYGKTPNYYLKLVP